MERLLAALAAADKGVRRRGGGAAGGGGSGWRRRGTRPLIGCGGAGRASPITRAVPGRFEALVVVVGGDGRGTVKLVDYGNMTLLSEIQV